VKHKTTIYLACIILAALVYFPIFGHLDTLSLRLWDESRLAVNTLEMCKDGDWIVTHYEGKPDMWNTKPPLMIWVQVGFAKAIGVNELSLRLPSAIAAFLTCCLLIFISVRYIKDFWFGFIAVIVLITTQGYISEHGARTGDYDSLVTLFIAAACFTFFLYTENQKPKYVYFFFISLTLAVLTKGITIMLFMPAFLIYLMTRKQLTATLRNKHFYVGLTGFLTIIAGYYALREHYNLGYLEAVRNNELGGRFTKVIEGNTGDFGYYYRNLIDFRMPEWVFLIPCGILLGMVSKDKKIYQLTFFSSVSMIGYFIVISLSETKCGWYDIPMFPLLAIIISMGIYFVFCYLRSSEVLHRNLKTNVLPFVFLFLICITPYKKIIDKTFVPREPDWNKETYELGYYLRFALKGYYHVDDQYILYKGYNAHNLFYIRMLQDKGIRTGYKDWTNLCAGDNVIAYQPEIKDYIQKNYNTEVIGVNGNITIHKILKRKPNEKETD